ncbi:FAD/NAD(P)-binding domain-containing protein [Ophiobolus disseminans]|uniref:FAD/NAD(P)-binding domain-containing protein n=1 Tax=Ophiobolus disseminans TaxID=1469910 RepID=A0A6A6ZWI8_9PLEO|nr:FAD/NAD(P)-binding domain-containing protein [Ophiobolus disseminans]
MQRTLFTPQTSPRSDSPHCTPDTTIDALIIGAGFAGCYALHKLRLAGFTTQILESGTDLGGVWHWNSYPGARVDSQWPVYALNIPEIYEQWVWSEHYPGHEEIKRYFRFVGETLGLYEHVRFGQTVVSAVWNEAMKMWEVRTAKGVLVHAKFLIPCTGFAAKRYFPDWPGLDTFRGEMHHSSFWPQDGVNVRGKKVAVVGTGATGVQIIQEWAREIGEEGNLTVFQRTPQMGFPMRQRRISKEENEAMKENLAAIMETSRRTNAGFSFDSEKVLKTFDHDAEERERYYESLWEQGGFRFSGMNYSDVLKSEESNDEAYRFWATKVRARIKDPRKRDLLAPLVKPHLIGGKRASMEQWYYDIFDQPNVDIVDMKLDTVQQVVPEGIQMAKGALHKFDVIALATGFDSMTGGLKAMVIHGTKGLLRDKWTQGVWTHLGMAISTFPNLFMIYGPQAPSAFVNGPSAVEPQADWIVQVLQDMKRDGKERIEATPEAEKQWKELVLHFNSLSLRSTVPSSWNGGNIPGKVVEPLSFAGGLPYYLDKMDEVREQGMTGFRVE